MTKRVLLFGKVPPIQGGVSSRTFSFIRDLVRLGHKVTLATNANSVQPMYAQAFDQSDYAYYENTLEGVEQLQLIPSTRHTHIPYSPSFETRLIGLASEAGQKADLIMGWYYQPYGVAAAVLASRFGKPCVLMHAGSDIGRLANIPEYQSAFKVVFNRAQFLATRGATAEIIMNQLGVGNDRVIPMERTELSIPAYFRKKTEAMTVSSLQQLTKSHILKWNIDTDMIQRQISCNDRQLDPDAVTIGVYGKAGEQKGHFDLLNALDHLATEGIIFNLVFCTGGHSRAVNKLIRRVHESEKLRNLTWVFPFIAPWRIPAFIKMCDAVAFLERDFEIGIHGPQVPKEVLWMGRALLCSAEIFSKQPIRSHLKHGSNVLVSDDPRALDSLITILRLMLTNRELLREIGFAGRTVARSMYGTDLLDAVTVTLQRRGYLYAPVAPSPVTS